MWPRLLGISDPKAALDTAISNATGLNFINTDLDIEDKTTTIEKLRHQISELESEVDDLVETASDLQRQLDERDREISKLRHMVHIDWSRRFRVRSNRGSRFIAYRVAGPLNLRIGFLKTGSRV